MSECPDCAGHRAHCACCGLPVGWCEGGHWPGRPEERGCVMCQGLGEIDDPDEGREEHGFDPWEEEPAS